MNPILQEWACRLGLRHQGVLLTGIRGCDDAPKDDPSKAFVRCYRAVVLKAHCGDPAKARTFIEAVDAEEEARRFASFRRSCDHYPHHYVMHLTHCVEVVGYKHFAGGVRDRWQGYYRTLCRALHVNPETEAQLDERLDAPEDVFAARDDGWCCDGDVKQAMPSPVQAALEAFDKVATPVAVKCHYCERAADRTVVWLKDKKGAPAEIRLPWCGCDLMTALKRFWPNPYQIQEGVDYKVEPLEKKPLAGLFCDDPATPEGKYLVLRRDNTVPPWPSFVLGAADPISAVALHAYAAEVKRLLTEEPEEAERLKLTPAFQRAVFRRAERFVQWRTENGTGDPGAAKHRKDDPAVVARMKEGASS